MALTEVIVRETLDRFFDSTAVGNKGHADVDRVVINGTVVEFRVIIVHKHQIKVFGQKVTVYSITTDVEGKVDVLNPDPDAVSYTINHPFGSISVSLDDVIKVLAAIAVA
ncbi:hypothetical protein [Bacillus safensis]|uniref:hypothetical protein n=1 Tax=Bacillus safensis TaxID=561879 RepID=UPI003C22B1B0